MFTKEKADEVINILKSRKGFFLNKKLCQKYFFIMKIA